MSPLKASTALFSSWCVFLGKNVNVTYTITGLQKKISKFRYQTWQKTQESRFTLHDSE